MTDKEIDYQLREEMNKFYNSVFNVKVKFDLIELFKKCVMHLAPQQHKISAHGLKAIAETKPGKLTVAMLEDVNKVILNVPLGKLYNDFDEAIKKQIEVEKFIIEFNKYISDFHASIQMKRATMRSIADTRPSNLRIIPTAQA